MLLKDSQYCICNFTIAHFQQKFVILWTWSCNIALLLTSNVLENSTIEKKNNNFKEKKAFIKEGSLQ